MKLLTKLFGSEGANPDAQKKLLLKFGGILVGSLVLIVITVKAFSSNTSKTHLKTNNEIIGDTKLLKEQQDFITQSEAYTKNGSRANTNNISKEYKNTLNDSFVENEEINESNTVNTLNSRKTVGTRSKVDRILSESMNADDPSSASAPARTPRGINAYPYTYVSGDGKLEQSYLSPEWRKILSPDYAAIRTYLGGEMTVYDDSKNSVSASPRAESEIQKAETRKEPIRTSTGFMKFPAGTVFKAVTLDIINSDYPSTSRARITSPAELSGSIVLLNTNTQTNDRIGTRVDKIIVNGASFPMSSVVKSGLPSLSGSVNYHIARKTLNPLAAAGLIAYGTAFGNKSGTNVNTSDAIRQSMIEQGINIGVGELNKYGGDVPNTINVPVGTPFEILLTEELAVR